MTCLVMWAGKSCSEREKGKEGLKLAFSSSSTHLSFVSLKLQSSVFALYVKPATDRLSLSECFWFIIKTLRRKWIFFCQFYFERQWKFEVEMLGGCAKMNHDANFSFFGQCDSLVDGNNTRKKRKSENNVK